MQYVVTKFPVREHPVAVAFSHTGVWLVYEVLNGTDAKRYSGVLFDSAQEAINFIDGKTSTCVKTE